MRVGIIGPESSGGRYLERLISSSDDCPVVHHWSVPYGPSRGDRFWPPHRCPELIKGMDKLIITVRDWHSMILSAEKEHTNDLYEADHNARQAYKDIISIMAEHNNWRFVTYESLASKQCIVRLFEWLELEVSDIESFVDGNPKWGGESWWAHAG